MKWIALASVQSMLRQEDWPALRILMTVYEKIKRVFFSFSSPREEK